ncbi:MAG TPA: hypothetical protein PLQ45_06280 [Anaerohalosphaeraceae bacterium]|jgi:hypothetical protein|nr:hypothetical protein [Anaerohalosphaeraceae bacterium]
MKSPDLFRFTAGLLVGLLAAGLLLNSPDWVKIARAGADQAGQPSIQVIPVQISRENQGIAMVDTRSKTIWVYELFDRQTGFKQIRLMAARTWEYDRLLNEWNSAEPTPQQIRNALENIHQQQMIEAIGPGEPVGTTEIKSKTDTTGTGN